MTEQRKEHPDPLVEELYSIVGFLLSYKWQDLGIGVDGAKDAIERLRLAHGQSTAEAPDADLEDTK